MPGITHRYKVISKIVTVTYKYFKEYLTPTLDVMTNACHANYSGDL